MIFNRFNCIIFYKEYGLQKIWSYYILQSAWSLEKVVVFYFTESMIFIKFCFINVCKEYDLQ